jgi:hypothetical protein
VSAGCKCKLTSCIACLRTKNEELQRKVNQLKADLVIADDKIASLEAEQIEQSIYNDMNQNRMK